MRFHVAVEGDVDAALPTPQADERMFDRRERVARRALEIDEAMLGILLPQPVGRKRREIGKPLSQLIELGRFFDEFEFEVGRLRRDARRAAIARKAAAREDRRARKGKHAALPVGTGPGKHHVAKRRLPIERVVEPCGCHRIEARADFGERAAARQRRRKVGRVRVQCAVASRLPEQIGGGLRQLALAHELGLRVPGTPDEPAAQG